MGMVRITALTTHNDNNLLVLIVILVKRSNREIVVKGLHKEWGGLCGRLSCVEITSNRGIVNLENRYVFLNDMKCSFAHGKCELTSRRSVHF